ncbi:hypothetical protein ACLB2K_027181 [Fragaria x ananassa]
MATYRALLSLKSSLDDPDSRLSALRLLNVFNRTFPPELSNLTNLRVLDLYNNNLTGVLPVSVATFHCAIGILDAITIKLNAKVIEKEGPEPEILQKLEESQSQLRNLSPSSLPARRSSRWCFSFEPARRAFNRCRWS